MLFFCQDTVYFRIFFFAFFIVMTCFIIDANNISSSLILGYMPKTHKIRTYLLEFIELFIVLKDI